jgi:UV DNA damage endonuclease
MIIRFGFVAIAQGVPEGSPNKTASIKTIEKISDLDARISRLTRLARENLSTTLRILWYNAANSISVYRLTSKLIPLATHPIADNWDYIAATADLWPQISAVIKKNDMRISLHPDHFTVLNSPKPEVLTATLKDLNYHLRILEALDMPEEPQLVMHVGGKHGTKEASLQRFKENFKNLPTAISRRIMLENDDRVYSVTDVLELCQSQLIPFVLDIHHHRCLNTGENLAELWPDIVKTWGDKVPKIHLSSPKSDQDLRAHAAQINPEDFVPFLSSAKKLDRDFDVMIEAKDKDFALFELVDFLTTLPGIHRLTDASISY